MHLGRPAGAPHRGRASAVAMAWGHALAEVIADAPARVLTEGGLLLISTGVVNILQLDTLAKEALQELLDELQLLPLCLLQISFAFSGALIEARLPVRPHTLMCPPKLLLPLFSISAIALLIEPPLDILLIAGALLKRGTPARCIACSKPSLEHVFPLALLEASELLSSAGIGALVHHIAVFELHAARTRLSPLGTSGPSRSAKCLPQDLLPILRLGSSAFLPGATVRAPGLLLTFLAISLEDELHALAALPTRALTALVCLRAAARAPRFGVGSACSRRARAAFSSREAEDAVCCWPRGGGQRASIPASLHVAEEEAKPLGWREDERVTRGLS
mmetsp:Transcript_56315/g.180804  ORF Transcript_56315/g.180804 Transcript_56315/m.180804 type:complete len:334 (+) Transcript_56315:613-1614(+)